MTRAHPRRGAGSPKTATGQAAGMPLIGGADRAIRALGANDNRAPLRHRLRKAIGLAAVIGLIAGLIALGLG